MAHKAPNIQICPSILAGDFSRLAEEVKRVEQSGADALHVDVMDGHFVPNLTIGPQIVAAINRSTNLFLDVHLMMYNPYDYIERFIEAGADRLTFHFEATEDVEETIQFIKSCGIQAGLSFCPETSMSMIPKYIPQADLILLMTVHPGFGGQKFMPEVLEKVRFTRQIHHDLHTKNPLTIQVDGGITIETAKLCAEAGANSFVAGTYLFSQPDMQKAITDLRKECNAHFRE